LETWSKLKATLEERVTAPSLASWITRIRPLPSSDPDLLMLGLPEQFLVDWVRNHYWDILEASARTIDPGLRLELVVDDSPRSPASPDPASSAPPAPGPAPSAPPAPAPGVIPDGPPASSASTSEPELQINDRYTFESFVVGDSNKLAAAAARSVAENPGQAYNPLFVFGRVGLGKTHLIQAIANTVSLRAPSTAVRYQTTEKFVNDVVQGIRFERMNQLRATYRACDILLIDDIQFIAGKEACQAEFFHTFNALHQAGKQVVVTSDKLPHEIPDLEERVKSRFIWGLIVDLQPPELETRVAIVKKKAEVDGIELHDDVAMFIAQSVRSNVRELEGCLIRASAYAQLAGKPLDLDLAKSVLRDVLPGKGQLTCDLVIKATCRAYDLKVSDLKGPKRSRAIALPRQIAMYLCRKHTGASYPEIGKAFGGKDHSTAINAYNRIRDRLEEDHELRRKVETIEMGLVE
jgi:chromosomal replication initiator protein